MNSARIRLAYCKALAAQLLSPTNRWILSLLLVRVLLLPLLLLLLQMMMMNTAVVGAVRCVARLARPADCSHLPDCSPPLLLIYSWQLIRSLRSRLISRRSPSVGCQRVGRETLGARNSRAPPRLQGSLAPRMQVSAPAVGMRVGVGGCVGAVAAASASARSRRSCACSELIRLIRGPPSSTAPTRAARRQSMRAQTRRPRRRPRREGAQRKHKGHSRFFARARANQAAAFSAHTARRKRRHYFASSFFFIRAQAFLARNNNETAHERPAGLLACWRTTSR